VRVYQFRHPGRIKCVDFLIGAANVSKLHCRYLQPEKKIMQRSLDFYFHYFSSNSRHGTHSPFMYDLVEKCIYGKSDKTLIHLRSFFNALKKNETLVSGKDFGNDGASTSRTIAHYAKTSSMLDFQAKLLSRLVTYFKPKLVLELGANIGKSASFMASVNPSTLVHTVDANEGLTKVAQRNLDTLKLTNVTVFNATFESYFEQSEDIYDMVFVDGNHHYEPTIAYFTALKIRLSSEGIIIFHDIYYNDGMKRAWAEIKKDQDVIVSLDLFFFGIVWFGKNQAKEDFKIRFPKNLISIII
jgi:predicted O-methyltransferase YrrM